jgi:hypothetical protein
LIHKEKSVSQASSKWSYFPQKQVKRMIGKPINWENTYKSQIWERTLIAGYVKNSVILMTKNEQVAE